MPPPDQTGPVQTPPVGGYKAGGVVPPGAPFLTGPADYVVSNRLLGELREQAERTRRREWAAALRYGAVEIRKWVGTVANPETLAAMAEEAADGIEDGALTPWADTPEPSTPPATSAAAGRTGVDPHPGPDSEPGVLELSDVPCDDADCRCCYPSGINPVLLVDPAVARVLDVARVVARAQMRGTPEWHAALTALAAVVDVLDGDRPAATCDTCSGTGWCKQEGQIGVPGSGCTHGCPDCEVGRARLAAGELLEPDNEDEPAPNPLESTACPRHTTWRDCAVAGCPPSSPGLLALAAAERAQQQRAAARDETTGVREELTRTADEVDDLRRTLAVRTGELEAARRRLSEILLDGSNEADRIRERAELVDLRQQVGDLEAERDRHKHHAEQLRERLDAATSALADAGARADGYAGQVVALEEQMDQLRADHQLIPLDRLIGYRVRTHVMPDRWAVYLPADVEIVLRDEVPTDGQPKGQIDTPAPASYVPPPGARLRNGGKVPLNLYLHIGDNPAGQPVGVVYHSPELAAEVAEVVTRAWRSREGEHG